MAQDVAEHTRACHECSLGKLPRRPPRNPRGPELGSYPFDIMLCDVLSVTPTKGFVKGEKGYDKLLIFMDSLTRWVEAIPFNGDPTSEDVLDAFLTVVLCRYGAPRQIRTDHGSNVASELVSTILNLTGVDLGPSSAEHHESIGAIERFNRTLIEMARTSDEGGEHWVDHLPFLLLSYRATPHRVTEQSPASLLFGRELRLPAQMGTDPPPDLDNDEFPSNSAYDYALQLNRKLTAAWRLARQLSTDAVAETVDNTKARSDRVPYKQNDRVNRLIHDSANKMLYLYSGPYRIEEVLDNGRYKLRDLENNIVTDEVDEYNLRPYRTVVDAEELTPDEYIVDELLKKRDQNGKIQYLVKWRQYPRSQATWEPRSELLRRCQELVDEFDENHIDTDNNHDTTPVRPTRKRPNAPVREPEHHQNTQPSRATNVSDELPSCARFARNAWSYGKWVASPRGRYLRYFPEQTFTEAELATFEPLRQNFLDGLVDVSTTSTTVSTITRELADMSPCVDKGPSVAALQIDNKRSSAPNETNITCTYVQCSHGFVPLTKSTDPSIKPVCLRNRCFRSARAWYANQQFGVSSQDQHGSQVNSITRLIRPHLISPYEWHGSSTA